MILQCKCAYLYCLEHLNSFVHLVWNEEDESSSTLKGIKIAVETEAETDDIVMEEESSKELPIEESKEEQILETTTGEHPALLTVWSRIYNMN